MTTTDLAISLAAFVAIYILLGVIDGVLMVRFGRRALDAEPEPAAEDDAEPALVY